MLFKETLSATKVSELFKKSKIRRSYDDHVCCYISEIAIDPEYQGKGIGKALIDLLIEKLWNEEIKYRKLVVFQDD